MVLTEHTDCDGERSTRSDTRSSSLRRDLPSVPELDVGGPGEPDVPTPGKTLMPLAPVPLAHVFREQQGHLLAAAPTGRV